ncbi:phosphoadenylyl-sulfate reductase (thioredoxin) [Sugiyamaella lignohabitans]|uniref:phosphoadenylyl-sulfate reductase (thioredoxin) n=1 Tax=Sugiyamaella lignohabitans TaxID=796027 RepID=A0A167CSA0_9ASCO|nr:phosphoadenylyl-sulfate reductase (thioredoxin) [Sugiyamaella lignohabitans]ANB12049.1 phosphoadenylyl-sulfate reductase (thioredoxin) [Sugiyamaella lignohabitans]
MSPSVVASIPAQNTGGQVSETQTVPKVTFTAKQLEHINKFAENMSAEEIIRWSIMTIPGLYQTTAFGLTGLVTLDIISKLFPDTHPIDLVFVDTLHHFQETLDLIERIKVRYPNVKLHIYKPDGCETREDFTKEFGPELWETNDTFYDYLVKVEPVQRAYSELNISAVFTGRRKTQGGQRGSIPIIEVVENGLIKINPLANWSFDQVNEYIKKNDVPYNALLDQGYRSVGDYHSTVPVKDGEDERAGRWKGKKKTECGIHETSRFSEFLKNKTATTV